MTYVVSDLNGHLDVFRDLLEKISFSEKRDVMYVLGDIVDYGPQPMELVQDLSTRINVYPIAGDRDYLFLTILGFFITLGFIFGDSSSHSGDSFTISYG